MQPELKAKWVAALRSGQYSQTHGQLKGRQSSLCCLGVLCVAAGAEWSDFETDDGLFIEDVPVLNGSPIGDECTLSNRFRDDLGISPEAEDTLIKLNDGFVSGSSPSVRRHSFIEIADYIEANL